MHMKSKHSQPVEKTKTPIKMPDLSKHWKKIVGVGLFSLVAIFLFVAMTSPTAVVDKGQPLGQSIHWHPHITIILNGEEQVIPANIGLSPNYHNPTHTHDPDGVIHLEQQDPTTKSITLGNFFKVWNQQFTSECIFDSCVDETHALTMTVNGESNTEFGDYQMQGEDRIVIEYAEI